MKAETSTLVMSIFITFMDVVEGERVKAAYTTVLTASWSKLPFSDNHVQLAFDIDFLSPALSMRDNLLGCLLSIHHRHLFELRHRR